MCGRESASFCYLLKSPESQEVGFQDKRSEPRTRPYAFALRGCGGAASLGFAPFGRLRARGTSAAPLRTVYWSSSGFLGLAAEERGHVEVVRRHFVDDLGKISRHFLHHGALVRRFPRLRQIRRLLV